VNELTRSAFLRRAAAGGGAVAAGAAVGWTAGAAAGAASEQDLAWLRFAIAAEFVSVAYYRQARAAGHFAGRELRALERATAAQVAHRRAFRTALTEQGEPAIDDADLELEPRRSRSRPGRPRCAWGGASRACSRTPTWAR
jgi:hypothetical protein